MATFDELNKYFDEYEATPQQQQLGGNFYAQNQDLTPYERMYQEKYGAPAQPQQEQPGILGSIANAAMGGQQQPNGGRSIFTDIGDTAAGINATRILTEQQREADDLLWKYHYDKSLTDEQRQEIKSEYDRRKQELDKTVAEVQRARQALQQSPNLVGNVGSHLLTAGSSLESMQEQYKYNLLGAGAGFLVGGPLGAAAGWKLANVPSAVLVNYRDAEAGAMEAWHETMEKTGNKELAEQAYWDAMKPNLAYAALATIPDVMIGQGVGKGAVNFGKRILGIGGKELAEEAAEKAAKGAAGKLKKAADAVDLDFAGKAGNWVATKTGMPVLGTATEIGARALPEIGSEVVQEGEQGVATNAAVASALHQYDPIANPDEGGWNAQRIADWVNSEEGKETMIDTAASTAFTAGLASAVGSIGSVVNGKRGNGQFDEFGNPNVKINHPVTNAEFPDAVAIAKNDRSTNLVDRMRNLEGRITYDASDGTNCARTIGLALAGTPYQDQINVDNFVAIAKEQGQLHTPDNYVPKPGDLAVVNNGNHIVMVSENGGTIQNGRSANGVYERAESPQQMFGKVDYYISTSELSSGDYGVSGNLVGRNEEQRQQEYYQNLIKQEEQRRADNIREVLGAKTHAEEQQEQAVLDAQKYQQENLSEIAPIEKYQDAFTQQELDAMTPEQHAILSNAYADFTSKKENWSSTLAETAQTMRGIYNQLVGNQQTATPVAAPAAANNVVNKATPKVENPVEKKTEVPATPNATETAAPVVQQQEAQQPTVPANMLDIARRGLVYGDSEALDAFYKMPAEMQANAQKLLEEEVAKTASNPNEAIMPSDKELANVSSGRPANMEQNVMARQAEEQKAIDVNIAKNDRKLLNQAKAARKGNAKAIKYMEGQPEHIRNAAYEQIETPREKLVDLINEGLTNKKKGLKKEQHAPLIAQANQAFQKGFQLLNEGKSVEEAFNAVKNTIGTPEQIANAQKEGTQNVTSEKPTELPQSQAGENRNQNANTEPGQPQTEKGKTGESSEDQNKGEVNKKAPAELAEGYKTEHGKPLSISDENDYILKPNGDKDFGRIGKEIEEKTKGVVKAIPVRLQVGNAEFGYRHLIKHMDEIRSKGFDSPFDFIEHVLNNFTKIYDQSDEKKPHRYVLYVTDETKGFMPLDLELRKDKEGFYTIVSAMPHKPKIKGTLIYDGSARPSTASTNGPLSTETGNKGGAGSAIVHAKSNVPFGNDIISQDQQESKNGVTKQNADNQNAVSEVPEGKRSGTVSEDAGRRKAEPVSRDEGKSGEEVLRTNDENVRAGESDKSGEPTESSRLSERPTDVGRGADEQAAVRRELSTAVETTNEKLDEANKSAENNTTAVEKAQEATQKAQEQLDKALDDAEAKADSKTTAEGDPALRPSATREAYEKYFKDVVVKVGNESYKLVVDKGNDGKDVMRWATVDGKVIEGTDNPLKALLWEAVKRTDNKLPSLDNVIQSLENKKDTGVLSPNFQEALDLARKMKKDGTEFSAVDNKPANAKYQAGYHGTDAVFDSFDLEHIGNGEGAQVHGWGLYFTKIKEMAQKYRDVLAEPVYEVYSNGKKVAKETWNSILKFYNYSGAAIKRNPERIAQSIKSNLEREKNDLKKYEQENRAIDDAIKYLNNSLDRDLEDVLVNTPNKEIGDALFTAYAFHMVNTVDGVKRVLSNTKRTNEKYIGECKERIAALEKVNPDALEIKVIDEGGSLLEVEMPDDDVLLDEQKAFRDQPEKVQKALLKIFGSVDKSLTGKELYQALVDVLGSPKDASLKLNEEGIKGIAYVGREDGPCAVIFDDKAIQIMQRYEAAMAERKDDIQRSLAELIAEAKRAFKGAKGFRINRNDLIFTMPNGKEITVNVKDQILLSKADEEKARKEHGLTDPNERIVVEGYARMLDKGSLVVLSKESGKGTAFHEAFHTVWDWVLTEKEKAAMLKHFTPIAEKQGIDVEEAMADGYRDWLIARQQHKGTIFGKLFQKIKDFANAALKVLTGTDSVHDIYRQIETGRVWNRGADGRFTKAEDNGIKTLVTNKKITADTQVPVVDVTGLAETDTLDTKAKTELAKSLLNRSFRIIGSDGIGFTAKSDRSKVDGVKKNTNPSRHMVGGTGPEAERTNPVRQKALTAAQQVLDNAIYIEKHPDMNHNSNTRYVDLYAAVQDGTDTYPIHIIARERGDNPGLFEVQKAMYYDLKKENPLPTRTSPDRGMAMSDKGFPTISVAELLQNVKDKAGRPYVTNGQLNYEAAAIPALTGGKASISVRKPTAVSATEDALTEELLVTVDTLKERTPKAHAKNIEALRTNEGFNVPATETDEASEQIISRMADNILYLFNKVPKQLRDRAKKWYDGGRRMAEEWSKRYGLSPQTISGVVAVLSPQKGWFENVSLAERILDCAYGRANSRWASAMDNVYTLDEDEAKKTGKIFIDEKNKAALERAKHRPNSKVRPTLGELLKAGDYKAAAIWIRCFDKSYNEPYYRTITPEGATGDYVFNDDGKTKTRIRWQNFNAIAKALAVAMNPSHTTIYDNIGDQHKVPNFFNNLNEPHDPRYVTIDTHAVAAAAMQPFSGNSKAVKQNFGGTLGAAGSAITGIKGTYPYYQEAYTRVAKQVGMLPREVQSIVWEAVRNIFPDKIKNTEPNKESKQQQAIREAWGRADKAVKAAGKDEQKVKKILANARKFAYNIGTGNGKLNPFAWENTPTNAPLGETYDRKKVAPPSFGDEDVSGVMVEVAPDPNDKEATARFNKLTAEQKAEVSKEVINFAVPLVMKEYGVDEGSYKIVEQIGGYKGATNPSFKLELPPQLALPVAKNLGYLLNQDSMAIVSDKPVRGTTPARMLSLGIPKSWGMAEVSKLYDKLYEIENNPDESGNATRAIDGHSTLDGSMEILNFSDYSDDVLAEKIREKIKDTIPNAEIESFKVYSALIEKADYGYKKEGAEGNGIVDRRTNNIQSQVAEKLERAISKAEGQGLSETADGVGQGNGPGTQKAEKSKTKRLLGQEKEGTGVQGTGTGRLEAKEASALYKEAAENFPQVKDAEVSNLVKDGIRQTVDFGKREGDILNSASGNHVRQGVSELRTSARPALHSLGEQTGGMPVYSEKGFGLTRELINEGVVDLTGRKVNSISDLAEIAQVLRHPGYEKLHYVYVKDGNIVYHETTTTGLPATAKAQLKGEKRRDYEARMRENLRRTGADALYLLHNHPDGDITPSQADFELTDFHKTYTAPSGVTFGGHIILDTTECNVLTGGKNESRQSIPEHAQIHYDAKADVPNILLGSKLGPTQALVDISKKLADQSTTTVFFTDTSDKVRSVIQLPSEFMQMDEGQMMRYLRWAAKKEFGTWAYIVTSDQDAYQKMLPLYRQGSGVYDILLTSNPETAKGAGEWRYSGKFNAYDYFGIESDASSAHKVLGEGVKTTEQANEKTKYSITSALGKAVNKADAYANRNVREPNMQTPEGRSAAIFNNTHNKNNAQSFTAWLKDRFNKFYREWVDKNHDLHKLDDLIARITGKAVDPDNSIYNQVQRARALANGAAETLVQGTEAAFDSLRDAIGRGTNPNDKTAMKRVQQLKSGFKKVSMQDVLEPIMAKEMDKKYPSYLEKHGINNWHDAFSNYLGARRVLELLQIAESKGLKEGKDYKLPKNVSSADLKALVANAPKEFAESSNRYYQLQRNMLILMEDGHLIDQQTHDFVNQTYKNYCPLMIDYSDTAGLEQAISQLGSKGADSIANVKSMLKFVLEKGSERGLISPLESTYKGIQLLTERAERNKVAVHFVKTVANTPELINAGILEKVDNKSADAKNCIFTVLINGQKQGFKTTQELYGPIVGYDIPAAGIVEGLCRSAAQTLRYGATTSPSFIIRNFIRDTIFAGISSRNGFVPVVDSLKGWWAYNHNKELRGEFDAMGITAYNYFGSGRTAVKSMEELMGNKDWQYLKNHPVELIKELVKYIPKKFEHWSETIEASTRMGEYMRARQNGKSMQEAALDARSVTLDFSRSGIYGQRVNTMVPFFNACIQGGDKMFQLLNDPKTKARTIRQLGIYIMLPSMLLWIFNKDEPWYEELDPHIKMNNWIIGGMRIPKPQEAGVLFGSGLEAIMDQLYNKDPHAMKNWITAMREVMIPNLIPTVGLPMLEWATNYSLFRDKAIEGNRLKRLPVEMRYNTNTTELSKAVGRAAGLSPVKLDNTIRGYTGTLGMLAAGLPDMLFEEKQNLPSKPITERVMVRDFFLNDMNMNRTSEDFYNLVNAAQQQHAGYGKKGKPTADVAAVNRALRDVSKQQKDIQTITNAKNINQDRKRQMIDKKRELIKTIQKKTLQRYRSKFNV